MTSEKDKKITVEAKVLCERLRKAEVVAVCNERAEACGVLLCVTAGKALIRHVDKHDVVTLLERL
jgi:hypothetical protein